MLWFFLYIRYRLNLKSGNVKRIYNLSIPTAPSTSVPWTTWSPWTSPSAQTSCSFDYGLCYGWRQSRSDVFDWTLRNGSTPSFNTGPSSDHTTGNGTYTNTVNDFTIAACYQSTVKATTPLRPSQMRPYYAGVLVNLGRKLLQDVNQCRYEHHYNYLSIVLICFALYAVYSRH